MKKLNLWLCLACVPVPNEQLYGCGLHVCLCQIKHKLLHSNVLILRFSWKPLATTSLNVSPLINKLCQLVLNLLLQRDPRPNCTTNLCSTLTNKLIIMVVSPTFLLESIKTIFCGLKAKLKLNQTSNPVRDILPDYYCIIFVGKQICIYILSDSLL